MTVTLDRVAELAEALPRVATGTYWGNPAWEVDGAAFAWERPLRQADLDALGDGAPAGQVVAVVVDDLLERDAVLAAGTPGVFTTPHFEGHPVVLLALDQVTEATLRERLEDAWLAKAPPDVAAAHLDG